MPEPEEKEWELIYWRSSGVCYVCDVHLALRKKDREFEKQIRNKLKRFQGWTLDSLFKAGYLEDIKNGLWELRISVKEEFRLLGVLEYRMPRPSFTALHGFHKKDERIRQKDMNVALARLKEFNS